MITNLIIAVTIVSAAMAGIDSLINRVIAKRRAKQEQVITLCADPRQAKHMLNLYCASEAESNERDWLNNPAMQRLRRQAKALR